MIAMLLFAGWCLYKMFAYLTFLGLRKKLQSANLDMFKDLLGNRYQFKHISDGIRKYKWFKGFVTIRGSFNEAGELIGKKISASFNFFKLNNEVNFQ
jgi:hypothetical protein